jgi:hypothetical protein
MNIQDFLKTKDQLKKYLIDYYDTISSEIDIAAQEILIKDKTLSEENRQDLVRLNELLIQKVKKVLDLNCLAVDSYKLEAKYVLPTLEEMKTDALVGFCKFVANKSLSIRYRNKSPLGVLIVCNWYLNENEDIFLK